MNKAVLLLLFVFTCSLVSAQKKPLDHTVYDGWQHIGEKMISNDGKWVVYTIDPQQGDNQLVIRSSDGQYTRNIARGYNALITEDSRYVLFKIKPLFKDTREARIRKKKPDDMPKDSLAILELGTEALWKAPRIRSYKTPKAAFGWVAYQLEKPVEGPSRARGNDGNPGKRITDSLHHVIDSLEQVIRSLPVKKGRKDDIDELEFAIGEDAEGEEGGAGTMETGTDLILRRLDKGEERRFLNVLEYYFSDNGSKLLVEEAANPKDSSSRACVLLTDLATGRTDTLSRGGNDFKNFSMTEDGSQVAYLAERDARPRELLKYYRLWYYNAGMDSATILVDKLSRGMQLGMTVSEFGNLKFSKSGHRLFFGIAPLPIPRDTTLVDFEHPRLDIWHYNDDYLQTVQTNPTRLRNDLQQNYLAMYDFTTHRMEAPACAEVPVVITTQDGDGDTFVGITDMGKRKESQWTGNTLKDIYTIRLKTGERRLVAKDLPGTIYISPTGKYVAWYDRRAKNYFAWNGDSVHNLSSRIKVPLYREDWDTPDDPVNYGVMGWMESEQAILVYDRYDIWSLSTSGSGMPRNITEGKGRAAKLQYRGLQLDPDKRYFTATDTLILSAFDENTKVNGLALFALDGMHLQTIQLPDSSRCLISGVTSQNNGVGRLLYTKETFARSPDVYVAAPAINQPSSAAGRPYEEVRLSSINPQQAGYNWGTAELIKWKAYNGKEATGIVFKPEDFDPKKKYPMIVYFYEKLSDGLYNYREPAPIRSAVNVPFFVSRGYIIFMPDIEYKTGHPGQGAYDYIVSGSRAIVKKGWADSTNIAIQGHSWGGYQAAQLATMTKLFKAVWAGAPVANMTSAYGGIRWESGVSRQFQYEKSQSRIGGTLWEKPQLYIENSPLFHLDKVSAPVVIMSNDADGAVPWYQGIELFTGLRRLGKKVWMFDYNGQGHGLTQRQDMFDYQVRMQQFFDWILKGDKPARWITDGLPAIKKGKEWALETAE